MRKLYIVLLFCSVQLLLASKFSTLHAQTPGNALSYDGTDDFLTFPDGIVAAITSDFTIEQWVYWRGGANFQRIFDFGRGTNEFMFLTPSNGTGVLFALTITGGGGAQILQTAAPLTINTWNHIAVTIDGTNTGKIYINGVLSASGPITLRPSALANTTQNWLGRSQFAPDPYFNGIIDELRISNSVRYSSNFTPPQMEFTSDVNTVALYHFPEGAGQTTNDAGANNFDGVLGATLATEASDPTWINNSILPITILDFTAQKAGSSINLNWNASTTQPGGSFIVERSENGASFQQIATLATSPVAGTFNYTYLDALPNAGKNFYRIKSLEQGSAARFSKTVIVDLASAKDLIVYPNPVTGTAINLALSKPYTGELSITVTNAFGSVVFNKRIEAVNRKEFKIDRTSALPAGNYLLQVSGNGINKSQAIICL